MESPVFIEEIKVKKHFDYVVGIDLGTYSTSVSFSHSDDDDLQTMTVWPNTNKATHGGRVASSLLYKKEGEAPFWGGNAHKKFYNESTDFFFVPHVKLYLTEAENQRRSPEDKLSSVQILSNYLQGIHKYFIPKMKEYYDGKKKEIEMESLQIGDEEIEMESLQIGDEEIEMESLQIGDMDNFAALKYDFTEDQVRYIFSYPDNQENNGSNYKEQIIEALIDAGIISAGDLSENPYESRVSFITDSGATAYHCSTLTTQLKPSLRPYLVCDIGGKIFGISTIIAKELPETGDVSSFIDQSGVGYGNLELDRKMRQFLVSGITSTEKDDQEALEKIRDIVFEYYNEEIKLYFDGSDEDYYYPMDNVVMGSTIKSDCCKDGVFVFDAVEVKEQVFDPVTNKILDHIEKAIKQHEEGVSGIFLSGTIGQDEYLTKLVYEKFGSVLTEVMSVKDNAFAVSKGLVQYGIRQRGSMVPYFQGKDVRSNFINSDKATVKAIVKVIDLLNEHLDIATSKPIKDEKKINHKGLDYFIGLDFGTTYSGFAYAPIPKNDDPQNNHTTVIKEVSKWPNADDEYPKVPSVLFYDDNMKYLNEFGYKAKKAMARRVRNGVLLTNFKLLLAREFDNAVDDGLLKKLNENTTVDAITNYLRDFAAEGIKEMARQVKETIDKKRLGYVVTVPAMWSDEAKNTMAVAIRRAGIVELNPDETIEERVMFITEAEAIALYCQEFFKDEFQMTKDQKFMICDCGGGTTDLATFQVIQENEGDKQLAIRELTDGDGDNCGSAYIDQHFSYYLLQRLQESHIQYDDDGIQETVDFFVKNIKPNFKHAVDSTLEDDYKIPVPTSLNLPYGFEDPTGFIVDDEFVIPYSVMEREVFMPVVQKVIDLVNIQLRKLPDGERQLDAILVVGGFGQSPYLLHKLRETFEGRTTGAAFIGRPPDGDLAKCRGAVSFGLKPRLVSNGITRYSYGLQVKAKAKPGDDPSQKFTGDDGEEYCHNIFARIIDKGDRISGARVYSMKTYVTYPHDAVFAIYSSYEKNANVEKRNLTTYGLDPIYRLTAKIGKIPGLENAKVGDKVELEVLIAISDTGLDADVYHNDVIVNNGVTKVKAIVKTKYVQGTAGKERKKKWRLPIFSLVKKY